MNSPIKLKMENNEIKNIVENKSISELIKQFKEVEKVEKSILNEFYKENKYLRLFPSLQYRQLYRLIKEKEENEIRKIFSPFVNYQINYYELDIIDKDKKIKKDFKGESFKEKLEFISEYWEVVFDFFGSIEEIFKKI